ncbi:exodeoxyribonuclease VII large subunit [candidate division TA06 bacterium]|uniref:Exodeoxyribonuclease 7 large subunit n=1 Tax=candidate division TA06 bacterium TaxID=2250710 RepID=A0A523UUK5_UNCT6|nr:MAG: exodeoxyribonuclease VII large subunit [candidate division TA06 bacterium]
MGAEKVYKVSEITRQLRSLLEDAFPEVWVVGEVSNFKPHSSGHIYFSLKDEASELKCVMFRRDAESLSFTPIDGMKVKSLGRITVYEKRGFYQLQVLFLMPAGVGELALAFEKMKARLQAEGLFDEEKKKSLPPFPARIGVVTSSTGAALRDILNILRRRWPFLTVVLRPARVQGEGASADIAEAIDDLNEYGEVDLIIVGRGGGSIEDLWAFNEEVVARAINRSTKPVVSAVGHEVDYTIADFVADLRAPTPSAAAEIVVPNKREILSQLDSLVKRGTRASFARISDLKRKLQALARSYGLRRPQDLVMESWQSLDELQRRGSTAIRHRLEILGGKISALEARLKSAGPEATLSRGYCICLKLPQKELVRNSSVLSKSDGVSLKFAEGSAKCIVEEVGA